MIEAVFLLIQDLLLILANIQNHCITFIKLLVSSYLADSSGASQIGYSSGYHA